MISKLQIFIFLVIITNTLLAQEVRYYGKRGTETDLKKAYYIETIFDQPDGHKILVKQKPSKDSVSYITLTTENPKIRDGKSILYYSSGKHHYVKYYRNNKLNGELTRYYEDGNIMSIVHFDADSIISMKSFDKNGLEVAYVSDTILPKFQNQSMDNFRNFLSRNLNFTPTVVEKNTSAKCEVSFYVTETGKVTDISVKPEIGQIKKEVNRVLKKTDDKWVPGEMYGEPSKVKLMMHLSFFSK